MTERNIKKEEGRERSMEQGRERLGQGNRGEKGKDKEIGEEK